MFRDYDVIEITKENEKKYLKGVVELEEIVLNKMEQEGKVGQLFITGEEGLKEYIRSEDNHIFAAVKNDGSNQVISAAYITRGQKSFTYNDITKYFKCGEKYDEYVRDNFENSQQYYRKMIDIYQKKIEAYRYARDKILFEKNNIPLHNIKEEDRNEMFIKKVQDEYHDKNNGFHEKSEVRENLNRYMTSYFQKNYNNDMKRYENFYWMNFTTMINSLPEDKQKQTKEVFENVGLNSSIKAYDKILEYQRFKIYDTTQCQNISNYYDANTNNTVELDTYLTHPDYRKNGIAEILTFEGIKRTINELSKENDKVYLASTLHEDNFASKYVSEFFGLKDYIFVNRRNGRDRQVHIFGMDKKEIPNYINGIEKKLIDLYNYKQKNIIEHEL